MNSKVETFRSSYLQICSENNVDPQVCVIDALERTRLASSTVGFLLDLSSHHIDAQNAHVLAETLQKDICFTEISFSDCCLPETSLRVLLHGLSQNTVCQRLNLKGNRILGEGAKMVAAMVRKNNTLKDLQLEWNHLGDNEDAFAIFADALSENFGLVSVSLENNRLNPRCGQALASGLRRNKSLQMLDLNWNNLGEIGAEALLGALNLNRSLTALEVNGNKIPEHLSRALEEAVRRNHEVSREKRDAHQKVDYLTDALKGQSNGFRGDGSMQQQSFRPVRSSPNMAARNGIGGNPPKSQQMIHDLDEMVRDRSQAYNQLSAKMAMLETQLEVALARNADIEKSTKSYLEEKDKIVADCNHKVKAVTEERLANEKRLLRDLTEARAKIATLENELSESESKGKHLKEQMFDLREKMTQQQAEMVLKQAQFDEKLSNERHHSQDALRAAEETKQLELTRVNDELKSTKNSWQERLQRSEMAKHDLEVQLRKLENQLEMDRAQSTEQLNTTKMRLKEEKTLAVQQMENKLLVVERSKEEMETQMQRQREETAEVMKRYSALEVQNEALNMKVKQLESNVASKDSQVASEVGKVRVEYEEKLRQAHGNAASMHELQEKLAQSHRQIESEKKEHLEAQHELQKEIASLKTKVSSLQGELRRVVEDEQRRMNGFRSAIRQYTESPLLSKLAEEMPSH